MNATSRTDATPEIAPGRRLDRTFVRRLADQRGWRTSQEIATGLGINRATYFRMLSGKHRALLDTARSMASRAEVTVDDLFPAEPAA
jgi:DNA-binding XRE family transcriptional regulator